MLAICLFAWVTAGLAVVPAIYIVYLVYKKRMIRAFIIGAIYLAYLGLPEVMASL